MKKTKATGIAMAALCIGLAFVYVGWASAQDTQEAAAEETTGEETEQQQIADPQQEHAHYLELERARIEREKQALLALREQVRLEVQQMESLRADLDKKLAAVDEQRAARIKKLVKVYSAMKANEVVPLLENLDRNLMLNVLYRMKEKKQSAILAIMEPVKAAQISKDLLRVKLD